MKMPATVRAFFLHWAVIMPHTHDFIRYLSEHKHTFQFFAGDALPFIRDDTVLACSGYKRHTLMHKRDFITTAYACRPIYHQKPLFSPDKEG
ncbi:hypothetical protein C3408_12155 [Candidatus Pantoea alvi]|nr:hypothetical protein C3408_12155 [Pantoea alvi]